METTADYAFSKCSKLHDDDDDIDGYQPQKLRDRFDTLPVHKCCYYASATTLDELMEAIDDSSSSGDANDKLVDTYGMTPLHIVATSARLRADMLKILLDLYPTEVIFQKDGFGKTMMDYLMMQRSSSKAIPLIKMTLESVLPRVMCGCSLDEWRDNLLESVESTSWEGDNKERWMCYEAIIQQFAHFIKMETTSILELALWKMKIGELRLDESSA
eukprot:CAMPEP_0113605618 /NCGR_PEP_ID=MMETSP0017_2-20120614/2423_1 /TAXON_ID=2856 /ORGANISM="Cylindrotheca closterium" /LENGTH=215 /DNA_ID=CAMNT_0000514119 /DNA_START=102 /DNA_END=745 /DNA_ORIENTATION=+ /assembly_acc=CAM_ASM_000147